MGADVRENVGSAFLRPALKKPSLWLNNFENMVYGIKFADR